MKYIAYKTPACPHCGGGISEEFTLHLESVSALPGVAGQFKCPKCWELINYILSNQETVDVLPFKYKMGVDPGKDVAP